MPLRRPAGRDELAAWLSRWNAKVRRWILGRVTAVDRAVIAFGACACGRPMFVQEANSCHRSNTAMPRGMRALATSFKACSHGYRVHAFVN